MMRGEHSWAVAVRTPDGDIDKGFYTLVDGSWNPLLDINGNPIGFDASVRLNQGCSVLWLGARRPSLSAGYVA